MKLLLLNQDWFAEEFREAGHEVLTVGVRAHLDVRLETPYQSLPDLIQKLPFGTPDAVVLYDESSPFFFTRIDEVAQPLFFYSVDAHHHIDVHRHTVYGFDHVLVAHKDYMPDFFDDGAPISWFPLWTSFLVEADEQKEHDAVFVGTMSVQHNPERVQFFKALQEHENVYVTTGDWKVIFPKSRCVINQTVKGDLNFRVFEAMGTGSTLLTERSDNGLLDLFEEGKHLLLYQKGNVEDARRQLQWIKANPEEAKRIGMCGREEVLAHHTPKRRAEQLLNIIRQSRKRERKSFSFLCNYSWLYRSLSKNEEVQSLAPGAIVEMMRLLHEGVKKNEQLTDNEALSAIVACFEYDRLMSRDTGAYLLETLSSGHPGSALILLSLAWKAKRDGDEKKALSIVSSVDLKDHAQAVESVFQGLDHFMAEVIPDF